MIPVIEVWIDGGCKDNGGSEPKAYGSAMIKGKKKTHLTAEFKNASTNNEAEYGALLVALDKLSALTQLNIKTYIEVVLYTDSNLVQKQLTGQWKCKADNLKPLLEAALDGVAQLAGAGINVVCYKVDREEIVEVLGH